MLSRKDLERLVQEASPALAGLEVHRIWRPDDDTWVLVFRKAGEAPAAGEEDRVALEIGLAPETARLCALPPDLVGADDPAVKKERKDDSHFYTQALRKNLGGAKLERIALVEGDRIAVLELGEWRLVVELTGRAANLILARKSLEIVLALRAGRPQRPLDPGLTWAPPPPREAREEPVFLPEIAPDPKTLALSTAVAEEARRV
jgi:hypothetical protein